jgi:hypothetical protein
MWNMQHINVPVITGATGIVIKVLKKNLEAMPGKYLTDALQKTAILGILHIIWKILQSETGSLNDGDYCRFRRSTRKKRPVTRDNSDNPPPQKKKKS